MAKFLGARGSRTQLKKLYNEGFTGPADVDQIALNLTLHAKIMQSVFGNPEFAQHRLVVSEGIYEPNPKFQVSEIPYPDEDLARGATRGITGASFGKGKDGWVAKIPQYVGERPSGILSLRRVGRAVVYQLVGRNGKTDPAKTFDLAVFWKDYIDYDKLTLDYDTFDPSGELTCQIVIETPEVPKDLNVSSYKYNIETRYNGELQTKNELLEILPEDDTDEVVIYGA
jgi:hypothetical protein